MENSKHYPTHPGAEHPPIMTCEIPLEEYESLKRENAELKAALKESEEARYEAGADAADYYQENRKLKRALWLARAHFCARSCEFFSGIMSHCLIGQEDLYNRAEKKKNKYLNAMYKCQAKAKQYK